MSNKINQPCHDFVAIDVEYANRDQDICQFGLAVVHDLRVEEKRNWLIQPPYNYYEDNYQNANKVRPEDTANEQTFDQVWPEIEPYMYKGQVWAHNAKSVEQPILKKHLVKRGFKTDFLPILDSRDLYQRPDCPPNKGNGLDQCCKALGIPFDEEKHHDATYDAEKCAEIVIAYANGKLPDWDVLPKDKDELSKGQKKQHELHLGEIADYYNNHPSGKEKVVAVLSSTYPGAPEQEVEVHSKSNTIKEGGTIGIDFDRINQDNGNLLQGKNVVVTGIFRYDRNDIEKAVKEMGAKRVGNNEPNKNTDVVILGTSNVGSKKLKGIEDQEANNHHIVRIVGDTDLEELLYGDGHKFFQD